MEIKNKIMIKTVNSLFQTFLVTYLLLLLIEQILGNSVSFYLNLNYMLFIVIILGILSVFTKQEPVKKELTSSLDYVYIAFLSIIGTIIIFIKTKELGWLSYIISIIAGLLIFLLSYLVLEDEEDI